MTASNGIPGFIVILIELTVPVLVTLMSYCLGRSLLDLTKISLESPLKATFFSLLLGYSAIGTITAILGYAHLLYPAVFWFLLVLILVSQKKKVVQFCTQFDGKLIFAELKSSGLNFFSMIILLIVLFYGLSVSLLPMSNVDSETVTLGKVELFKLYHKIFPVEFMYYGTWPDFTNMVFLFSGMLYKSSIPAYLLDLQVFFLFALGIFLILREYVPVRFALLGTSIFCVSTDMFYAELFIDCRGEFFWGAFSMASYLCFLKYIKKKFGGFLLLMSVFLGFAASSIIIFSLMSIPAVIGAFAMAAYKEKTFGVKKIITDVATVLLVALSIATLWYLPQIIHRSNPFYPIELFHTLKSGDLASIGSAPTLRESNIPFQKFLPPNAGLFDSFAGLVKGYLFFPWEMTFARALGHNLTPVFLFLVCCLPLIKAKDSDGFLPITTHTLIIYVICSFSSANTRHFVLLIASLTIACVLILYNICQYRTKLGWAAVSIVVLIMGSDVYKNYFVPAPFGGLKNYLPVVFDVGKRRDYLNRNSMGLHDVLDYINKETPKEAILFFYKLVPGYYFERKYIWGDNVHAGQFLGYSDMKDRGDLLSRLKSLGIDYLLLNTWGYGTQPDHKEEWPNKLVPDLATNAAYFLYGKGVYSFYRLAYDGNIATKSISATFESNNIGKDAFVVKINDFLPGTIYQVEGVLETLDLNEWKSGSDGILSIKSPFAGNSEAVARFFTGVNTQFSGDKVIVKSLITPHIKGNGEYLFEYKHYPSISAVKMVEMRVHAYN